MQNTNPMDISTAAKVLGRKGGLAKTKRKADAVRKNGQKGGRPMGSKSKKKSAA